MAGIMVQDFFDIHFKWIFYVTLTLLFVFIILLIIRKINNSYKYTWLFGLVIYLFLFFSGLLITMQKSVKFKNLENIIKADYIFADIIEYPENVNNKIKLMVDINLIKSHDTWINEDGKAIIYIEKDSLAKQLQVGDRIVFKNLLFEIENSKNPYEFDYKQYLKYKFVNRQGFLKPNDWNIVSGKSHKTIKIIAQKIRQKLLNIYRANGITGDNYAITSALTLGYKNDINPELRQSYSAAGAMHVLAVSGLHVGIIYLILEYILFFFKKLKKYKFIKPIIIITILWLYALITGLSPSVIRAAFMFSLISTGQTLNRPVNIYNIIAVSAFFILLINPYMIFEIGFQLSYLAVLAIVFFQPPLYKLVYFKNVILDKLWALLTVSIAAQLGTAPITMYYFNQFPNYFFISNFIVIPAATLILISSFSLIATSWIPYVPKVLAIITNSIVSFLNKSVVFIHNLPYSTVKNINLNGFEVIILYSLVIIASLFFITRKKQFINAFLTVLIIFLLSLIYNKYYVSHRQKIYVYNIYNTPVLDIINGENSFCFTDKPDSAQTQKIIKTARNNWIKEGVKNNYFIFTDFNKEIINKELKKLFITNQVFYKYPYIHFAGYDILWLTSSPKLYDGSNHLKTDIDFVILNNNISLKLSRLTGILNIKKVIISSSNYESSVLLWSEECKEKNISYHDTRNMGAFIYDINKINNKK